jgi:THO complex subunit 3
VEKVLFNPVREFELASCSGDGTVRFWDTKNRTCTTKLDVGGDAFTLTWSVDGTVLVVGLKVCIALLLNLTRADTIRTTP